VYCFSVSKSPEEKDTFPWCVKSLGCRIPHQVEQREH
jgi:hypothetical protein